MDTTFPHTYEVEQLNETPGVSSTPHFYYLGGKTTGGRDGVLVKILPQAGQAWLGTFGFSRVAPTEVSGVFTMPDPEQMCVVAKGQGYLVSANLPTNWL